MKLPLEHLPEGLKLGLDGLSITVLLGSLISVLPTLATLLTVIWSAIRIYETPTVQRAVQRLSKRKEPDA